MQVKKIRVHIPEKSGEPVAAIAYVLRLFAVNTGVIVEVAGTAADDVITVGTERDDAIRISRALLSDDLTLIKTDESGMVTLDDGTPDLLATAFYYAASVQELNDKDPDDLGRFRFHNSMQRKFGSWNRNIVQECFDKLATKLGVPPRNVRSTFFLSHDIDMVNGAILEDGLHVIKKGRPDLLLQMLFRASLGRPDWLNIDQIMRIESAYDCLSTFYWIVNKGKIDRVQKNADYDFRSEKIQKQFRLVAAKGFGNGLHKSLSRDSFREEIKRFGSMPKGNRYHYLKFNLPEGYEAIESSGIPLDASLGFSEQWGFRNNYGLPFNPFDFKNRRPFRFVEVPLHVMDRTFFNRRMSVAEAEREIFRFLDENRKNCVLSVLWHNNFFTEYKFAGYLALYKKILSYIKEGGFGTTDQDSIINNYSITWP